MPQKKSSGGKREQQGAGTQVKAPVDPALVSVDGDPVLYLVSIVDKKARNLEKRKVIRNGVVVECIISSLKLLSFSSMKRW